MNQHEYAILADYPYDQNLHFNGGVGSALDTFLSNTRRKVLGFERARRGNERYWVVKLMKEKA